MTEKRTHFSAESCDLKPCPFCGSTHVGYIGGPGAGYRVECSRCLSQSSWGDYGIQAKTAWNKRLPDAAQPARDLLQEIHDAVNVLGGRADQDNSYDQGIVDTVAKVLGIIEKRLASQPSPAATVDIERLRAESLERQEQICETNDRLMAAQDQAHSSAATDYANGLRSLSGLITLTPEQSDFLHDAAKEFERIRALPQGVRK